MKTQELKPVCSTGSIWTSSISFQKLVNVWERMKNVNSRSPSLMKAAKCCGSVFSRHLLKYYRVQRDFRRALHFWHFFFGRKLRNPTSYQNTKTGLASQMTVETASERENFISICSTEANTFVNLSEDGLMVGRWTSSLIDHPPFEYPFIQEHLMENSLTMPNSCPAGAHRYKKLGYSLLKEEVRA